MLRARPPFTSQVFLDTDLESRLLSVSLVCVVNAVSGHMEKVHFRQLRFYTFWSFLSDHKRQSYLKLSHLLVG